MAAACNGSRADRTPAMSPPVAATDDARTSEPAPPVEPTADDARYRRARQAMAKRLEDAGASADDFHFVIEPPFVVAGDEDPDTVEARAVGIVRWAARHLESAYFATRPAEVIEVWLFKDADSYERHNRLLFGGDPGTPYGYYLSDERALVMNIATGGGTLVHEIVHPYVEANFPECPAWFNEGLGSLYEQSAEKDGAIVGLTNWRLAGLQEAIRTKSVPKLSELVATSTDEFYGDGSGVHYAAARYLLYYLQEQGSLRDYYRAFTSGNDRDPTGRKALENTVGMSLDELEPIWQRFVLGLRFE